jgi:hypothetical protein
MYCPRCDSPLPVSHTHCRICGKEFPLRYVRHLITALVCGAAAASVIYVVDVMLHTI